MPLPQSTADTVEGAVAVAVFLVVMFLASRVMVRFNRARFDHAFAPLVGVIGGTLASGGEESRMTGTWVGRDVVVAVSHDVRTHLLAGDPNAKRNLLEVTLSPVTGREKWRILSDKFHRGAWTASSPDDALAARLTSAGAVDAVRAMGPTAWVEYTASLRTLTYTEDIRPRMAPSEQRLRAALDLLAALDRTNARENGGDASLPA